VAAIATTVRGFTSWNRSMFAADPPVTAAPSEAVSSYTISSEVDSQSGMIEVVVVGTRPDQVQKIDRRTYQVKDNPHSAQADSLQLLRGLPAVTITPDDKVMLLGAPKVTLLVDDRPVRGNVVQYLRILHGRDIERIEIVTNPSAQYSPEGTGGIINIVLRKNQRDGLSGAMSGEASTLGRAKGSVTVKYKQDPWIYEFQAQGDEGRTDRSRFHKLRTARRDAQAAPTINTEDGSGASRETGGYLSAKLTRLIDERTSVVARVFGGDGGKQTDNEVDYRGLTADFESFSGRQRSTRSATFGGLDLSFDRKGTKDGETLKINAASFGKPEVQQRFEADSHGSDSFSVDRHGRGRSAYAAAIDWQHPIGTRQILSLGGNWLLQDRKLEYRFTAIGDEPTFRLDEMNAFDARTSTHAAYATFQQKIGTWAVMPGVRFERYAERISSSGRAASTVARTTGFPSFHLQHALSETLDLTVSYSERIDRPDVDDLRPYPVVASVDTILMGNPELREQSTDSYEINLHYHRGNLDTGVIVYDRQTSRLWANSLSVNAAGENVVTPINSGRKRDIGAQFDVTTALLKRIKATASLNLFDSRVPIEPIHGDANDNQFRYTINATLEWNSAEKPGGPGNIAQLQATYDSPSQSFQIRNESQYSLSFSYTHSFSRTLSLTGSLNGIGSTHNRYRLSAPLVQEDHDARTGLPVFKINLSKTFGDSK
jgi:outer membrane receptor for ferrienterochelin and colicin